MLSKMNRHTLVATALLASAGVSQAAVDLTAVTGVVTDVTAAGVAVLGVYIAIKLYKWVRRAL